MKYSRRVAGIIALALIAVPFVSSALTLDELNQQISSLLSQVAALQQKIAGQTDASVPPTKIAPILLPLENQIPSSLIASCPQLTRSLSIGSRGEDVYALQRYLIAQQLLSFDSATGFYGPLTQSAVQNWQSSRGVVSSGDAATTGFGVVGARTRSMIALNCSIASDVAPPTSTTVAASACRVANPPTSSCSTGWKAIKDSAGCTLAYDCATPLPTITPASPINCPLYSVPTCGVGYSVRGSGADYNGCALPLKCSPNPASSSSFAASPTSGVAPVNVYFSARTGGVIDFGDGSSGLMKPVIVLCQALPGSSVNGGCDGGVAANHTYTSPGTYTAKLLKVAGKPEDYLNNSANLFLSEVLGNIIITIGGSGSNATVTVSSPAAGSVYKSGDAIPISWSTSGITDISSHRIEYRLVPLDANQSRPVIGTSMYGEENMPGLSGTKNMTATNGGWWPVTNTGSVPLDSRYVARVTVGVYDANVCKGQYVLPGPISQAASVSGLAFASPQYLALSLAPCSPYRIIAIGESPLFVIRQPRLTGTVTRNDTEKVVTATVTARVPDGCKPFEIRWSGPSTSDGSAISSYTPAADCTSGEFSQSFTRNFPYHSYGAYEASGSATLYYGGEFGDLFSIPIPQKVAVGSGSQLASALGAMEAALKAMLGRLGQ